MEEKDFAGRRRGVTSFLCFSPVLSILLRLIFAGVAVIGIPCSPLPKIGVQSHWPPSRHRARRLGLPGRALDKCHLISYMLQMIKRFRHGGLERFFRSGDTSGIDPRQAARLRRLLTSLNVSTGPSGMNLPGYRLHRLKGEREGQWAVSVSGNWRLVFAFEDENATAVDLVDYH
jgi:proteic killer suppression protein